MTLLQPSINLGLTEEAFWNMSVAEIQRFMEGAVWRMKSQAQFDYTLANLIGVSVARIMSKDVSYPQIEEVYPDLFEDIIKQKRQEKEQELKMNNSVNNFMAFAMKHNSRLKGSEELTNDNDK
jgi:flagellar biosynthesis protein FliP